MTTLARVAQLWVFPVKSMSGSRVEQAEVGDGGLVGDRSWAVVDDQGQVLTARTAPRLRDAVARLVDGEVRVDLPGAAGLDAGAAGTALSDWLGRPVHLEHRAGAGFVDVAPVHLVSTRSMADATHAEDCDACDVAAPRANVVVELSSGAPDEREWVGRELRTAHVGLSVVRVPKHCLGVYADVCAPGRLAVGDELDGR